MPLYVADAMDAAEREALRRHLAAGCAACAGWLAEAQATFAAVPLGLDPVEPPPALLQRVMQRIDRTAGAARPARSPFRLGWPLSAAAAAAVITFLAVTARDAAKRTALRHETSDRAALLRTAVADRDRTVEQLRRQLGQQQQLVDALQNPAAAVVTLAGVGQKGAAARLVWDAAGGRSVLLATHLAAPGVGRTYELWFIPADAKPRRAATFTVDPAGSATVMTAIPAGFGALSVAAVSDEPAGGTDAPTGAIQLAGKP